MIGSILLTAFLAAAPNNAADDAATAQAKKLFVIATTNYEIGRYDEALSSYLEAYALKPLPAFQFNIGLCHRKLGNHHDAVVALERYLAETPKVPNRADVELMLAEERTAAANAPPPPPPPPDGAAPDGAAPAEPLVAAPPADNAAGAAGSGDDPNLWVWGAVGGAAVLVAAVGTVAVALALSQEPAPAGPTPLARIDLRSP